MPSPIAHVTLTVEDIATAIDEAIEARLKDMCDRVMLLEMNVSEVRQKALGERRRVRVPAGRRVL